MSIIENTEPGRSQLGRQPLLIDLRLLPPLQAEADANGVATVESDVVPNGEMWQVTRLYVTSQSSGPSATVLIGGDSDQHEVDSTSMGDGDAAEYSAADGLIIPTGQTLRVRWDNATQGDRCTARLQIRKISFANVKT